MTTLQTIWKFTLELRYEQILKMPVGAKLLCAQFQREQLCLWAIVYPGAPLADRRFWIAGTGDDAPAESKSRYIGTVQVADGRYAWHVFEAIP